MKPKTGTPLQIRLTSPQRRALNAGAKRAGMSVSAFVRELALGALARPDLCDHQMGSQVAARVLADPTKGVGLYLERMERLTSPEAAENARAMLGIPARREGDEVPACGACGWPAGDGHLCYR